MVTLINLMRHEMVIYAPDSMAVLLRLPSSAWPTQLEWVRDEGVAMVDDQPISSGKLTYTGAISNAPEPREGVLFVVPRLVAAVAGRPDFVFPDDEVRSNGVVIGCRRLSFAGDFPQQWTLC